MNRRPRAVALVLGVAALTGVVAVRWWPSSAPALDCAPEQVHLGPDGVARCGPGAPLPAGAALTVGQRLDLNAATADALAELPGVGPELARALIAERARLGRFHSWDEVDAVSGVGPARLLTLQGALEIR
jgi:competence protein ComEA